MHGQQNIKIYSRMLR